MSPIVPGSTNREPAEAKSFDLFDFHPRNGRQAPACLHASPRRQTETGPYKGLSLSPRAAGHAAGSLRAMDAWVVLRQEREDGPCRVWVRSMPKGREPTPAGIVSCPLVPEAVEAERLPEYTRSQFILWRLSPGFSDRRQALLEFAKVRECANWVAQELRALDTLEASMPRAATGKAAQADTAPTGYATTPATTKPVQRASEREIAQQPETSGA